MPLLSFPAFLAFASVVLFPFAGPPRVVFALAAALSGAAVLLSPPMARVEIAPTPGRGGLPRLRLPSADGTASAEVYLHGATVTSWHTGGREMLFLSSAATFDGVRPIRGGVPVVFPQFAAGLGADFAAGLGAAAGAPPLPFHGLARTRGWTVESAGPGRAELSLRDDDGTRAVWPHAFALRLTIAFDAAQLTMSLHVLNPAGAAGPFYFEALLHTYLAVEPGALPGVRLAGLRGLEYVSKPEAGARRVEEAEALAIVGETDRIYLSARGEVRATGLAAGASAAVDVRSRAALRPGAPALSQAILACPLDVVIWNPGEARAAGIADLGADEWRQYVCIEPGRVSAETAAAAPQKLLAPGMEWTMTQTLTIAA